MSPWTVLAQGLSTILPVSIGMATFLVSARRAPAVDPAARAARAGHDRQRGRDRGGAAGRRRPDPRLPMRGPPSSPSSCSASRLIGLGSGLYLTTNLGPGPRDGWMTGIHLRTGGPSVAFGSGSSWSSSSSAGSSAGRSDSALSCSRSSSDRPSPRAWRSPARWGVCPARRAAGTAEDEFPELDA